jgi:hypothetical protein
VRYADSVGYHGDQEVTVWPYRDWVIRAFAENMPFDRFTREQLGGDLLPSNTLDQRVAAAYNRLGMMSAEGGAQAEEYLLKYASDRVRDVSGAWLGSTRGSPTGSSPRRQLAAHNANASSTCGSTPAAWTGWVRISRA